MTDALTELLDVLRPAAPRVSASWWAACGEWGVYIFDGGTQLAGAMAPTLPDAIAACLREALGDAKGEPVKIEAEDLF